MLRAGWLRGAAALALLLAARVVAAFEPITVGLAIGAASAITGYLSYNDIYCRFAECCREERPLNASGTARASGGSALRGARGPLRPQAVHWARRDGLVGAWHGPGARHLDGGGPSWGGWGADGAAPEPFAGTRCELQPWKRCLRSLQVVGLCPSAFLKLPFLRITGRRNGKYGGRPFCTLPTLLSSFQTCCVAQKAHIWPRFSCGPAGVTGNSKRSVKRWFISEWMNI